MEMKTKSWAKEYLPYIVIIIIIILVRTFIATPVRVSGNSMTPTLENGEIMILNKVTGINRYDIVVVSNSVMGEEIIKRVIGMPNDTVEMKDGVLYINDEEVEDKYAHGITDDFKKVYLGSDEYWVMGDNRSVSMDSRVIGKIKRKDIKGVTRLVLFPFNKIGNIQ